MLSKLNYKLTITLLTFTFGLNVYATVNAKDPSDQFDKIFLHIDTVDLPELKHPFFKSEFHFVGDFFCIVDQPMQQIRCFNDKGEMIKEIGGPGSGPGEFGQLIMIDFDQDENILAALDVNRRVTFFDGQGIKLRSLIIRGTHHNFDIAFAGSEKQYIALGGLSFNSSNYGIEEDSGIIHIYDNYSGDYIRSFHPAVKLSNGMDLRERMSLYGVNLGVVVKTDFDGSILIMQPLEYSLTRYDVFGNELGKPISNVPEHVEIVNEPIPVGAGSVVDEHSFWYEKSRHLVHNFFVSNHGYIFVVQTFQPLMYSISIYDRGGNSIKTNIPTDKELRAVKDSLYYFTSFNEEKNIYQLHIYKLNL